MDTGKTVKLQHSLWADVVLEHPDTFPLQLGNLTPVADVEQGKTLLEGHAPS